MKIKDIIDKLSQMDSELELELYEGAGGGIIDIDWAFNHLKLEDGKARGMIEIY
jgi:hypothetical protein